MSRRTAAIAVVVAGLAVAVFLLRPKKPLSDEEQIRALIERACRDASEKDVAAVMELVSDGYRGEAGNKQDLKRYLLGYILRSDWVTAVPSAISVKVEGDAATATFAVLLARAKVEPGQPVPPEAAVGTHHLELKLAREAEGWKVVDAARREAAPSEMLR